MDLTDQEQIALAAQAAKTNKLKVSLSDLIKFKKAIDQATPTNAPVPTETPTSSTTMDSSDGGSLLEAELRSEQIMPDINLHTGPAWECQCLQCKKSFDDHCTEIGSVFDNLKEQIAVEILNG